ncbi:cysteine proteinase [Phlegmacium glaucopus]|nr:cysteine proteinase [Phlegmacium glaucopus]
MTQYLGRLPEKCPALRFSSHQWLGPCPSWCLEFLDLAGWIETSPKEQDLNGIFLLPHEQTKEMWEPYQKGMNISRLTPYSNLLQKDYTRLLQPQLWLNDEIVNTYMALIRSLVKQDHLVLFSHFYQKISLLESCHPDVIKGYLSNKRDPGSIENILARYSKIIFPVHWSGDHWLTVVLDIHREEVVFMDSLRNHTAPVGREVIFQTIYKQIPLSNGWSKAEDLTVAQQKNGHDCGVYCCQFMKFSALGRPVPLWTSEHDLLWIRRMMAMEIYQRGLRWFPE